MERHINYVSENVFPSGWEQEKTGNKTTFTSTENQKKMVSIENKNNGLLVSGTQGTENDIVKTAVALKNSFEQTKQKATFEINAPSYEKLIEFLSKTDSEDFNVKTISAIRIKNQPISDEDSMKDNIAHVLSKAQQRKEMKVEDQKQRKQGMS